MLAGQITAPVLVMHGEDDQVVPYADSGMPTTQAEIINADPLAWLQA